MLNVFTYPSRALKTFVVWASFIFFGIILYNVCILHIYNLLNWTEIKSLLESRTACIKNNRVITKYTKTLESDRVVTFSHPFQSINRLLFMGSNQHFYRCYLFYSKFRKRRARRIFFVVLQWCDLIKAHMFLFLSL